MAELFDYLYSMALFESTALIVRKQNTSNPNDPVSKKAIDLKFFDQADKRTAIGEASVSAIDTNNAFLYNLEVYKKFRGKGYGNRIMEFVLKHYHVKELTVEPDNEIAINLYKKYGFKESMRFKENGKEMIDMKR